MFILITIVLFMDLLDKETDGKLDHNIIAQLDSEYGLTTGRNVELSLKWFMLCIHNQYTPAFQAAAAYATQHGRMKYCRPVLR